MIYRIPEELMTLRGSALFDMRGDLLTHLLALREIIFAPLQKMHHNGTICKPRGKSSPYLVDAALTSE
jgi:hypothetical protein